jgi:hypothetical protein
MWLLLLLLLLLLLRLTSSALRAAVGSMRMSMGPSEAKLNPRSATSS